VTKADAQLSVIKVRTSSNILLAPDVGDLTTLMLLDSSAAFAMIDHAALLRRLK
jgi:hypothetical protein